MAPPKPTASKPMGMHRNFHRIAWLAVALAFGVIVFGAFVRLSNAGLSCPDWPTCYGRATWPKAATEAADHAATAIRAIEPHKAWREQVHRMLAGSLGIWCSRSRCSPRVAAGMASRRCWWPRCSWASAFRCTCTGNTLPHPRSRSQARVCCCSPPCAGRTSTSQRVATLTLAVIIFQALLGMWTVTLLLKPIVVMGHLLGGLTTFSLLTWMAWRATDVPIRLADARGMRVLLYIGLGVLALQIALGGWTSANYAALACANDFPKCVGQWVPPTNFHEGFVLWRGIGVDYEGGVLDGASRIAIQMAHRMMAVVAFCYLGFLAYPPDAHPGHARVGRDAGVRCCSRRSRSASPTSSSACRCTSPCCTTRAPRCCCSCSSR
jgi:cytochrome c oxidase assembly protein subunit 15